MAILAVNAGSSLLKFSLHPLQDGQGPLHEPELQIPHPGQYLQPVADQGFFRGAIHLLDAKGAQAASRVGPRRMGRALASGVRCAGTAGIGSFRSVATIRHVEFLGDGCPN